MRTIRRRLVAHRDLHKSIHEARKAVRRLRAILLLVERRLDAVSISDRALERLGDSLSAMRDAHVVIQTAARIGALHPETDWTPVVKKLRARCERVVEQGLSRDPDFMRRLALLARVEAHIATLPWGTLSAKDLDHALERGHSRVAKAEERAKRDASPDNLHRWRRRARKLRMQLDAMRNLHLADVTHDSAEKRAKALRRLVDNLGWRHDVSVLRNFVRRMTNVADKPELLAQMHAELT